MKRPVLTPYDVDAALERLEHDVPAPSDGARWKAHIAATFDALAGDARSDCPASVALVGARRRGYDAADLVGIPDRIVSRCLGTATAIRSAEITSGMAVADLGCGAGLDALIASRLVGQAGRVVGLDLSQGMVELARGAARAMGVTQVRFVTGDMARLPLGDESLDRVLCNWSLSLVPDVAAVLGHCCRVLVPGGALVICDAVDRSLAPDLRAALSGWGNGVGTASDEATLIRGIERAGLAVSSLQVAPLGVDDLVEMAVATAPDMDRDGLVRAIDPLVRRLAGTLGLITVVARRRG